MVRNLGVIAAQQPRDIRTISPPTTLVRRWMVFLCAACASHSLAVPWPLKIPFLTFDHTTKSVVYTKNRA